MQFKLFGNAVAMMNKRKILFIRRVQFKDLFSTDENTTITFFNIHSLKPTGEHNFFTNTFISNRGNFRRILFHMLDDCIDNGNMERRINTTTHIAQFYTERLHTSISLV